MKQVIERCTPAVHAVRGGASREIKRYCSVSLRCSCVKPLRQGAPTPASLWFTTAGAVPKHNSLKINFNYEETNERRESGATLAGWNRFNMQKNSLILPKIQGEAAKQKPPPASSSQSSLAAAHRQLSGRTRTEGAGGKRRDLNHLPTCSPTPLRKKVSSFLSSSTSFFPSSPFHPFAKPEKTYVGVMQLGRREEEEKGGPAASTRRDEMLVFPPEWE